VERLREQKMD